MKVAFLLPLLLLICSATFGQTDTIRINGFKFITVTTAVQNDYNKLDTAMKLYRIENGKPKYLLEHFLYAYGADCNNEYTDKGSLKIQNDSLIFQTDYKQKGSDPIPLARKQIYRVNTAGKLLLISDQLQEYDGEWINKKSL